LRTCSLTRPFRESALRSLSFPAETSDLGRTRWGVGGEEAAVGCSGAAHLGTAGGWWWTSCVWFRATFVAVGFVGIGRSFQIPPAEHLWHIFPLKKTENVFEMVYAQLKRNKSARA
jgi:hypothetical protein